MSSASVADIVGPLVKQYGHSLMSAGKVDKAIKSLSGAKLEALEKQYNLGDTLKGLKPDTARTVMSELMSGSLSTPFVTMLLPKLKEALPKEASALLEVLTQAQNLPFMRVLNEAFLTGTLDRAAIEEHLLSPENVRRMRIIVEQKEAGGIKAIDETEVIRLIQDLDLSKVYADSQPLVNLVHNVVRGGKFDSATVLRHMKQLAKDQAEMQKRRASDEQEFEPATPSRPIEPSTTTLSPKPVTSPRLPKSVSPQSVTTPQSPRSVDTPGSPKPSTTPPSPKLSTQTAPVTSTKTSMLLTPETDGDDGN